MDFFEQMEELNRPSVQKKPWMESVSLTLAKAEDLDRIVEECIASGLYGLDVECTGLDARVFEDENGVKTTMDRIVGVCIAPNETTSYYVPMRHSGDGMEHNVPPRLVADAINRICAGKAIAVFHNAKFDTEFLEHDPAGSIGDWDDHNAWDDTLILAYLNDPREKRRGLKYLADVVLNREMIELKQLFPQDQVKAKNFDFSTLDPSWPPVVWYAAADSLNTLALRKIYLEKVVGKDSHGRSQKTVYQLEKLCLIGTRWMERCRVPIDRDVVENLIRLGQKEWLECLSDVYTESEKTLGRDIRPAWFRTLIHEFDPNQMSPNYMESREIAMAGGEGPLSEGRAIPKSVPTLKDPAIRETVTFPERYDVTIPGELGVLMREVGVPGLVATDKEGSNQVKTSKDVLDKIFEEAGDSFPFMAKVGRFREVAKALSSNLFPIYRDTAPERSPDGRLWVGFNGFTVDTGRFSTPVPNDNVFHGQARWNIQSTPATYDPKKPACVAQMRTVIRAKKKRVLFAVDYSGVELRIVTNLSGEPKWVEEFFRCSGCDHRFDRDGDPPPLFCPECGSDKIGDLHTLTAMAIYGEDCQKSPEFKNMRKGAKALNFAMCYGGGGSAASRSVGVDTDEGWRIKRQFDKTYKGLTKWWDKQHHDAKGQLYVTTAFGRKYPVPDIISPESFFRSTAERNSVNGPVQGTSADITKFAMGLIYREIKKKGWLDRVRMCVTIHDELVFEIDEDIAEEAVDLINEVMAVRTVKNLNWVVPLGTDIEFGDDWTVPFNLNKMVNKWDEKALKDWDDRWKRVFPKRWAQVSQYVEGASSSPPPPSSASDSVSELSVEMTESRAPVADPRIEKSSTGEYTFRIGRTRLSADIAKKIAAVVFHCEGRGTDTLRIISDAGEDLVDNPLRVSYAEFRIVCGYEGL